MTSLDGMGPQLAEVELVVFDFDGVFTDNTVLVSQDGVESVTCWRSDGLGLSRLASLGVQLAIISTETNPVVSARARKLRIQCVQGVADKCGAVRELCAKCDVAASNTMYVGNDINDISAFEAVGWPVAVADAYPEVFSHVRCMTSKPGGRGAVREVCDLIYRARIGAAAEGKSHVG